MGKSGDGKDGRVIAHNKMAEETPGAALRLRKIQIAAPNPFPAFTMFDQRRRFMVMDHDEVGIKIEDLGVPID